MVRCGFSALVKGEKMKRFFITTLLLATLGITTPAMAENVAIVDVSAVLAKSSQLQALKKEQQTKIQELEKWLKNVKTDVDKQQTKEGKEKLIKKYDAEFVKKQQDLRDSYIKKLLAVDKNIAQTITNEAKAKGYDLVITKGVVLYGGTDITDDIIKVVK